MEIERIKGLLSNLYLRRAAIKTMLGNLKDSSTNEIQNILLDNLIEFNKAIDILEKQLKNLKNE